ncbi:MAG: GNAT family N-acetyltransferase [Pseudomonadota bacterium]
MTVRAAHPSEADALTALMLRSKAHWPYDENFMAVMRRTLRITADDIIRLDALVHETDGLIEGVGVVEHAGEATELQHLWVDPPAMGRGIGRSLFRDLLDRVHQRGARRMLIESDPFAETFYLHMGATRIGERAVPAIPGRVLPLLEIAIEPAARTP